MGLRTQWPYAAKANVQHEWFVDLLYVWVTFKFAMDQTVKPAHNLWKCEADDVPKDVTVSAWQDEWTILLTVPDVLALPDRVTLEYDGPSENLRITWDKQWEPWGPILSLRGTAALISGTKTHSAVGPTDDLDVAGIKTVFIDCSANNVTIGGLVGGVNGQVLHFVKTCDSAFNVTLEHIEGTGNQDLHLHAGIDETLKNEYGGWTLACKNWQWYDVSHSKHV